MAFSADDIRTLAETVWEATLAVPLSSDGAGGAGTNARSTVGAIQITGAWNGAVMLDCSTEVAKRAAAAMFSTLPETVSKQDMQEAVAELVNIMGGNLKALLPEKCFLSLPSVIEGGDYSTRVPGSRVINREDFSCEGHRVTITILERAGDTRDARERMKC